MKFIIQMFMQSPLSKHILNLTDNGIIILKASMAGFVSRIIMMLVSFISVSVAIGYLGAERYGLWMAATSFVLMLSVFSDGGVSNALVTATAKIPKKSLNNMGQIRILIGSALAILIPLALIIITIAAITIPLVSWRWVFNLNSDILAVEAQNIVLIVAYGIALGFIVNVIPRVRTGLEQIPAISFWDSLAAVISLLMLILAVTLRLNIIWLVMAIVIVPLLVKAFGSFLYLYHTPSLVPRLSDINLSQGRNLLSGGSVFFITSLTYAISIQSDQILIANLVGVEDVAIYSVMQRLFALPWIFANFIVHAQWPTLAKAAGQGDYFWVRKTFYKTLFGTTIFAVVFSTLLLSFYQPILTLWVGKEINPTWLLVSIMSIYAVLIVIWGVCSMLFISLDARREQIILNILMLTLNLPLSIILIQKIGAAGAILGTVVSYLLCMILPSIYLIPKILNRHK